jgi:hypothetical protein
MNARTMLSVLAVFLSPWLSAVRADGAGLPAEWRAAWATPSMADRPLQIVHGIPAGRATPEGMKYYKDHGLGGIVCNVAFDDYLRSEKNWKTLVAAVETCRDLGLIVWIYDEEGYPSGEAGGLVLAENRDFEAVELAYDRTRGEPFFVRPAYEFAHAANNFHAARRCPNLIDDRAMRCFIEKTHDAYWRHLEPYFGQTIQAVFTDEPSLMAVNLGSLGEEIRKKVRVVDPPDPAAKPLPSVPWGYDLVEQYRRRWGEDLVNERARLFGGDTPEDRRVRRQFWSLIADLTADRYFGAIGRWCAEHRIASSGHSLWEEEILHHVPLEGNGLKVLGLMDVPGLDMLSSDPASVIHTGWLSAAMPSSAGLLHGHRRVMTEVSDFSQKMAKQGPATLEAMRATAAWQAGWGVTEFTLYYGITDRSAEDYRAYCDYVGRLNSLLKPAQPARKTLLYYPIHDLWEEYLPTAERLNVASQSPRMRRLVGSFMRLGQRLQRSQIPFNLVDHENLASARVESDGRLTLADQAYETLVLPAGVALPEAAAKVVEEFCRRGGRVVIDEEDGKSLSAESLLAKVPSDYRVSPPSEYLSLGAFARDSRRIVLVTNVGGEVYRGRLAAKRGSWLVLDPAVGTIQPVERDAEGAIALSLDPRQAKLLVEAQ